MVYIIAIWIKMVINRIDKGDYGNRKRHIEEDNRSLFLGQKVSERDRQRGVGTDRQINRQKERHTDR